MAFPQHNPLKKKKKKKLGLSLSSILTWKTHMHSLAKQASQRLGFLARARGIFLIFSPSIYSHFDNLEVNAVVFNQKDGGHSG